MFRRFLFLGLGLVALLGVMATPDQVDARNFRGGGVRAAGFSPTRNSFGFGMQHHSFGGAFRTHNGSAFGTHNGSAFGHRGGGMMHTTSMRTPNMRQPTMNTPTMNTPTMNMPTMNTPTMNMPTMNTPTMNMGTMMR